MWIEKWTLKNKLNKLDVAQVYTLCDLLDEAPTVLNWLTFSTRLSTTNRTSG